MSQCDTTFSFRTDCSCRFLSAWKGGGGGGRREEVLFAASVQPNVGQGRSQWMLVCTNYASIWKVGV